MEQTNLPFHGRSAIHSPREPQFSFRGILLDTALERTNTSSPKPEDRETSLEITIEAQLPHAKSPTQISQNVFNRRPTQALN
jgi:hypothetical protein